MENGNSITKYTEGSAEQREFLSKIEGLQKALSIDPPKEFILNHEGKFEYIPVSYVEHNLDKYFFGHWSTYNFKYQQIINEIVADIILEIINPVTGERLKRTGAAAVTIMQSKGATLIEFTETKIKTALVMGFPRLKAECIKNAAKSLGKKFGRDLNRKHTDSYNPLMTLDEASIMIDNVLTALDEYTGEDKDALKKQCREIYAKGEFTETYANGILAKIGEPV